ncbi:hypothetical protein BH18VER1_BH18VER1_00790 [soil metagenome]
MSQSTTGRALLAVEVKDIGEGRSPSCPRLLLRFIKRYLLRESDMERMVF